MAKRIRKIALYRLFVLVSLLVLFILGTFIFHKIKSKQELELLKEHGYYNPVSIGEYSLNVAVFGKEDGAHTIVGLAGLGMGEFSVAERQMTACLEEENLVVFVDRAGYGFSDDTNHAMTLSYIVEDYRKALQNAGIDGPYILMPHSIGGAYANYWVSHYPEEIEAIVFVDGSQLSANAFEEEEVREKVSFGDRMLAVLAKLGLSRYVLHEYLYRYPDNYSEEEQYLGDALYLLTMDSVAPISEANLLARNAQEAFSGIVTNEVPKLYICASWGFSTVKEFNEYNQWMNRQIEINSLDFPLRKVDYTEEDTALLQSLKDVEKARQETIYPYAEKMGNCQVICLAGDHMIYEQKPVECGQLIKEFIDTLN